jgi:CRISPR system Cascade subunit CasB
MTSERRLEPKAALSWWRMLQPDPVRGGGDRGAAARLRRASLIDAICEPATIDLFRAVGASRSVDLEKVATLAGVLAHVRNDAAGQSTARLLGPNGEEKALLSPLRFRRLLDAQPGEEQLTVFRRMAALAGGALPVQDLAESLLNWDDRRRIRWTYDYWNAGRPQTPSQSTLSEDAAP